MLGGDPAGATLTDNFVMLPTSAVAGFYFGHRDQYFGVARMRRDQLEEYAGRRGVSVEQAEPRLTFARHPSRCGSTPD